MAAVVWRRNNRQPLTTTDYVLDEWLRLLRRRESHGVAVAAGEALWRERTAQVEHISVEGIARAWEVFQHYRDKDWSFTGCTRTVVMERLGISHAFAFDGHFEQFGSVIRVP
jgi:uncharacterized protein